MHSKETIASGPKVKALVAQSCPILCNPMDYQALLSMDFSRQEYWSGLPFPSPVDLPDPGIKPGSPAFQVDSLPSESPVTPLDLRRTKKLGSKAEEGNRLLYIDFSPQEYIIYLKTILQ